MVHTFQRQADLCETLSWGWGTTGRPLVEGYGHGRSAVDLGRQTEAQNVVGAQWSQDPTEGYSAYVIRVDRVKGRKGIWNPFR